MIYEKFGTHHISVAPIATAGAASKVLPISAASTASNSGNNIVERIPILNKPMIDTYYQQNVLPYLGTPLGAANNSRWQALLLANQLGQEIAVLSY